jgi:hypothetical protein
MSANIELLQKQLKAMERIVQLKEKEYNYLERLIVPSLFYSTEEYLRTDRAFARENSECWKLLEEARKDMEELIKSQEKK